MRATEWSIAIRVQLAVAAKRPGTKLVTGEVDPFANALGGNDDHGRFDRHVCGIVVPLKSW